MENNNNNIKTIAIYGKQRIIREKNMVVVDFC